MSQSESSGKNTVQNVVTTLWGKIPSGLMLLAASLILISIAFPYWGMVLQAPQYPGGLEMRVFVNRITGDEDPTLDEVREIDGLNHYIGMRCHWPFHPAPAGRRHNRPVQDGRSC
jgi:hypothetical protein